MTEEWKSKTNNATGTQQIINRGAIWLIIGRKEDKYQKTTKIVASSNHPETVHLLMPAAIWLTLETSWERKQHNVNNVMINEDIQQFK